MNLELHATAEEVMRAVEALQQFGESLQVPGKLLFGLTLALEECGSNIVNHSLRGDARQTFRVTLGHAADTLIIELRDHGPMFDPTKVPARKPAVADDDLPPGGWGVQLVRHYTDELCYTRENDENVLRLSKKFDCPAD